jgi:hypothetical protein
MASEGESLREYGWRHFAVGVAVVVILLVIVEAVAYKTFGCWEVRGQFGDMFGFGNAIFSAIAFAGVIFAILLQKNELTLQRDELRLTRVELAGQRKQLALQVENLHKQNFESTFFQMLNLLNQIVESIDLRNRQTGAVTTGRDCFESFFGRFKGHYARVRRECEESEEQVVSKAYRDFYGEVSGEIGHYFRYLYHIVRFVDESDIENKELYAKLVRAQLSTYELVLLFYNCLSPEGRGLKSNVEKYSLLKHFPKDKILDPEHLDLYKPTAFQSGKLS